MESPSPASSSPPSLRDAAKALAQYLRQNSAMLTMQALNAIMAVEAAVEREKALADVVDDLRQRLGVMATERDKWREAANFAGTLRNQLVEAEAELSRAQQATNDLHRMLEDAGVPGVNFNMVQMSLAERIRCLIDDRKRLGGALEAASEDRRDLRNTSAAAQSVLDDVRKILCPPGDGGSVTAAATGAVKALADMTAERDKWCQEANRLRAELRAVRETLWDCQTPDFPPSHAADHLHYAYMPGDWSSMAGEWFTYSRVFRNGQPTKMVRVGWRHGPGVSNRSATLSGAGSAIDSAIEKVLASWRERGKCDPKFATEVLGRFVEPKVGIVRDPVTGWTFDKFRRELEAARTTAKGNAGLYADAMNQLAAAKGGA